MIAALPMYDWPALTGPHDRLWALIRDNLRDAGLAAPDTLDRSADLSRIWRDAGLVLGQTCGMPYRTGLHGHVALVGTPDYGLPDAPAGYYYSEIVVAADDRRTLTDFCDLTLAYNGQDSQSGWAAPQNYARAYGFRFTRTLHTKAHRESAAAVARGDAEIAAIDAVTWRLIGRHMPEVAGRLRVLCHTDPTPGLPLICAPDLDRALIASATEEAIAELAAADRADLGIRSMVEIPAEAYLSVPTPPPPSQDASQN